MNRIASVAAVAIMAVSTLSACGGGGDYCGKLQDYDKDKGLENVDFSTEEGQQKALDVFKDLESSAPDDLKDDYKVVIDGFTSFLDGDLKGVDQKKLGEAFTTISDDAKKNCEVDMNG